MPRSLTRPRGWPWEPGSRSPPWRWVSADGWPDGSGCLPRMPRPGRRSPSASVAASWCWPRGGPRSGRQAGARSRRSLWVSPRRSERASCGRRKTRRRWASGFAHRFRSCWVLARSSSRSACSWARRWPQPARRHSTVALPGPGLLRGARSKRWYDRCREHPRTIGVQRHPGHAGTGLVPLGRDLARLGHFEAGRDPGPCRPLFRRVAVLLLAAAGLAGTIVQRLTRSTRSTFLLGFSACLFLAPLPWVATPFLGDPPFFARLAVGMFYGIDTYGLAAVAVPLMVYAWIVVDSRPSTVGARRVHGQRHGLHRAGPLGHRLDRGGCRRCHRRPPCADRPAHTTQPALRILDLAPDRDRVPGAAGLDARLGGGDRPRSRHHVNVAVHGGRSTPSGWPPSRLSSWVRERCSSSRSRGCAEEEGRTDVPTSTWGPWPRSWPERSAGVSVMGTSISSICSSRASPCWPRPPPPSRSGRSGPSCGQPGTAPPPSSSWPCVSPRWSSEPRLASTGSSPSVPLGLGFRCRSSPRSSSCRRRPGSPMRAAVLTRRPTERQACWR